MDTYRCTCGFEASEPIELTGPLIESFDKGAGTDGRPHPETVTGDEQGALIVCSCGLAADAPSASMPTSS